MKITLIGYNCRYTHSCLSLFYLRNELLSHLPIGADDIILNQFTINDPYFNTLIRISSTKADVYFFSVYICNVHLVLRTIHDLSATRPKAKIILGGPQAAALQTASLPAYCTVISGEIEGISQSFYSDMINGKLLSHYRAEKAQSFPSPYLSDDFSTELANRHIYYESSRGCPYSCSYCLSSTEQGVRNKEINQVKDELKEILAHKPQTLRFIDRTFNASAARALEIWQFLIKESSGTTFHFEIAPDLFTEEMFCFLKTLPAGFFQFEIGIQSTHAETLSAINRKSDIDRSIKNIKRLADLKTIHIHVDLILGLPFETFDSFSRSFDTVFSELPHHIQMGLLKILPQTPISKQVREFSLLHCSQPPYQVLSTQWLSHKEVTKLYWFGECVEAFYNNRFFRSFFQFIQKNVESSFLFFLDLLDFCAQDNFFEKAKTQRYMSRILTDFTKEKAHADLLKEILQFDWLRSGNRFLPDHLGSHVLKEEKNRLWSLLPQENPPLYSHVNRNTFFKQTLFIRFSGKTMKELGLNDGEPAVLCILNEKEASVFNLNKVVVLKNHHDGRPLV